MRAFLYLLLFFLGSEHAYAMRYVLTPSIGMGGTYDDRVQADKEDWYLRATPSFRFSAEQEDYKLQTSADFTVYRYSTLNDYDRVDQDYKMGLSYVLSPRASTGFNANIKLDTDYEDEYEEGRISGVDASCRQTYSLAPYYSYMLDERNRIDARYSISLRENDADYNADYVGHMLSMTWTHLFNEQLDLFGRLGLQRTEYESAQMVYGNPYYYTGELTQDSLSLIGGFTYRFSERLEITLALGGGDTRTSRNASTFRIGGQEYPLAEDEDSSSFTYLVNSNIKWSGERFTVNSGYDRDIYSSADGEDVVRDIFRFSYGFRFTELTSLGSTLTAIHRQDSQDSSARDDWYYAFSPSVIYRTSENSSVRLGYTYSENHYRNDDVVERNRLSLDYTYAFPVEY